MIKAICLLALAWLAPAAGVRAETCQASFYAWESGRVTASGECFQPEGFTPRIVDFFSALRLCVSLRGRSIVVRDNDRGPIVAGRCVDLAVGAAAVNIARVK